MALKEVVLIIEDQMSIAMLLHASLSEVCEYPILILQSLAELNEVLDSDLTPIIALCDLNLPDAPKGETVHVLRKHKITTVVLTGSYDDVIRERMLSHMVADYVVKNGPAAIQYVVSTVVKLIENSKRSVWILTCGTHQTQKLLALLKIQRYKLKVFESYDEIKDMLAQQSPDLILLEGVENIQPKGKILPFIQSVRAQFSSNVLPIISCEPTSNIFFAIHLMKYGVNDFFNSNFTAEELHVRVHQNIQQGVAYKEIQKISHTDGLTGLFNRRYFFEQGDVLLKDFVSQNMPCFVLMIDIDFFKKVNDTYGHQVGDNAISYVADSVKLVFDGCVVARFGGEEYCVLGSLPEAEVLSLAEKLRQKVEAESITETTVAFTLSIGVTTAFKTLDEAVGLSDQALYESKKNGRNQVTLYRS